MSLRVLIIVPDGDERTLLSEVSTSAGHGVTCVDDRDVSGGCLENTDLIFFDWSMAAEHIASLCNRTRKGELDLPHLIVLFEPSHVDTLVQATRAGVADSLSLPLTPRLVEAKLSLVDSQRKWRQSTAVELSTYRALVESPSISGWRYWRHSMITNQFVHVSRTRGRPSRYEPEQVQGERIGLFDLVAPTSQLVLETRIRHQIEQSKKDPTTPPAEVDIEWFNVDGSISWRRAFFHVVFDDAGQPIELRGINTDITDLMRAETKLRLSEQYYRSLFEYAHDAIIIFRPEGEVVVDVNQRACELYGLERGEFIGMSLETLTENVSQGKRQIDKTLEAGVVHGYHTVQRKKDGTKMLLDINASVVEHDGERAILSINRDITDQQVAMVEQRRRQEALQHAHKLEVIGRLAGGVAHDFNNLVMVITSCAQALEKELEPWPAVRREVDDLLMASRRAMDLVRQLLAFSRRREAQRRPIHVYEVTTGLSHLLRRSIDEDIELETTMRSSGGFVKVDQVQLEQVLVNLIVNARDAIDGAGHIDIEVDEVQLDETRDVASGRLEVGHYVTVVVRDDGVGMGAETLAHVFEPFFTTKPEEIGTGLGLYTIHSIVNSSGGALDIDTQPGHGTAVTVYLPSVSPDGQPEGPAELVATPLDEQTATVMIVEDDESLGRVIGRQLERHGYRVLRADDGQAALELLRRGAPEVVDVVLTDVVMPGMSGGELAKNLAAEFPLTKVIYMTGHTERADVAELGSGAATLVEKPFSTDSLLLLIAEVLGA